MTQSVSPGTADRFALTGATLEARFRVARQIAEGGFGVVYDAHHLGLDVRVALKVLKVPEELGAAARAEFIEKFLTEAKTMARIRHPYIVQVLDTGASVMPSGERAPWIVLEWLDGYTLDQDIQRSGVRSPAQVFAMMRPVLEAVAYAHDDAIAHRDLKPENVMLVQGKRGQPVPKLLDFGIAKLMDHNEQAGTGNTRTSSKFVGFSPYYAAPEQIGQARTGPWTDVHALGLMLSEMLVGHPVLPHGEMTETIREIYSHIRPTPAKFGVVVGAWEPVLARALAYKPDQRFNNASELLAALEAALPGATHSGLGAAGATPPGAPRGGPLADSSPVAVGAPAQSAPGWSAPGTPQTRQGAAWSEPRVPPPPGAGAAYSAANAQPGSWPGVGAAPAGNPQQGYSQPGHPQPQAQQGYSQPGYPQQPQQGYSQPGYPQNGYPQNGYPQNGYPQQQAPQGYSQPGHPQQQAQPPWSGPANPPPGSWPGVGGTPPATPASWPGVGGPGAAAPPGNTGRGPLSNSSPSGVPSAPPGQAAGPWHNSSPRTVVSDPSGGHPAMGTSGTMMMDSASLMAGQSMEPRRGATTLSGAAAARDAAGPAAGRSKAPLFAVGGVVLLGLIGTGVFLATRDNGSDAPARGAAAQPGASNPVQPAATPMPTTAGAMGAPMPGAAAPVQAPAMPPVAPVAVPAAPPPESGTALANPGANPVMGSPNGAVQPAAPGPSVAPVAPVAIEPQAPAVAPDSTAVRAPEGHHGSNGYAPSGHHSTPQRTLTLPVEPGFRPSRPSGPPPRVGTNGTEIL